MAYMLSALLLPSEIADVLTHPSVPLASGLTLVPIDAEAERGATDADADLLNLPRSVIETVFTVSERGPVAYVEAEFFGGVGRQAAIAWERREVVFGPRFTSNDPEDDRYEDAALADSAINQVLRLLGVSAGRHRDEFEAVGLHRYRENEEWLLEATGGDAS